MKTSMKTGRSSALTRFVRVIRGVAEASLVVLGFAFVIVVIGTPIALIVGGLHEGLSWLARASGDPSAMMTALVPIASVAAGVIVVAALIRAVVAFFLWRRRLIGEELS